MNENNLNNDPTNEILEDFGIDIPTTTRLMHDTQNGTTLITDGEEINSSVTNNVVEEMDELVADFEEYIGNATSTATTVSNNHILQPPPIIQDDSTTPPTPVKEIIPNIPKDLTLDDITSRFSGATWYEAVQKISVIVGGAGGIGSNFIYNLARIHPASIYVYDDDVVERANLAGQMFDKDSIDKHKVDAVAALADDFSDYHKLYAIPQKFTEDTPAGSIMVAGFDNMAARTLFFDKWENYIENKSTKVKEHCIFIDGRLSLDEMQIFCITGNDLYHRNLYRNKYLFPDWKVRETQCSMKQTAFCANMIGSLMVNLLVNFVANTLNPVVEHSVPFKTYYGSDLMYFKIED